MTLAELAVGESGQILAINTMGTLRRRLMDLGLIEGTRIVCVLKSPFNDPTAFALRGTIIALRAADCQTIEIERAK